MERVVFGYRTGMIHLREYRRVIGAGQVLYLVGRRLKRQGVRYTTVAAVIGLGAVLTDVAGNRIFGYDLRVNKLDAAMLPAVVALLTFGLGHSLIALSNLFSAERILMADANGLNLMEDRKKADMRWHLQVLWERVFQYEARLREEDEGPGDPATEPAEACCDRGHIRRMVEGMDPACRRRLGIDEQNAGAFVEYIEAFRPVRSRQGRAQEGFCASAGYALAQSLPQKVECSWIGFDLSLLEDWYDGAFFTANDTKLQEQFAAHQVIRAVRECVGLGWRAKVAEVLFGHPVPLWHALTMKKIGTRVGTLIGRMNRAHTRPGEPAFFNAQDFLWKHPASDVLVEQVFGPGVLDDLRRTRRALFHEIFSPCRVMARAHIFRMFGADWRRALALRMCFDVEFAAGCLDATPTRDLDRMEDLFGPGICPAASIEAVGRRAAQVLAVGDEFLADYVPDALETGLRRRAARIGWYLNTEQVRREAVARPDRAAEIFRATILPCERQYTQRVCLLRQHYELTRLQLLSYVRMVEELAEYNETGS